MLEFDEMYTRGGRTKLFILLKYGWFLTLLAIMTVFAIWEINFGFLHGYTLAILDYFKEYYVDTEMLSEWLGILALGLIILAYLRGSIMFRNYKFLLDDHAFHLQRGIFLVKEVTIPYHQISNVHIIRPYHYRVFGLAQVDIATASDRRIHHSKVKDCLIPMIDYSLAKMLSKQLISYADRVKDGEDLDTDRDDDQGSEEESIIEDHEFEENLNRGLRGN